jgi:hypothetical protein
METQGILAQVEHWISPDKAQSRNGPRQAAGLETAPRQAARCGGRFSSDVHSSCASMRLIGCSPTWASTKSSKEWPLNCLSQGSLGFGFGLVLSVALEVANSWSVLRSVFASLRLRLGNTTVGYPGVLSHSRNEAQPDRILATQARSIPPNVNGDPCRVRPSL